MFKNIMTAVDLEHADKLADALDCAADLAKHYGAPLTYVGVASSAPSAAAHNPEEYRQKLQAFAESEGKKHGIEASAHMEVANDPATEVDDALLKAIEASGTDLIVMASHVPGVADYILPSNGGQVAHHAKCSVMLIRP
ncbi:universal stress protein [Maritalea mediterranea]|uniref:Universal stress protein n=1 Tax=Maritalea mediterranea TaxID=2909667 RepID=A0ABS9E7Z2_9HYPH|nr:universal stress protein [Maritalea mediterranea]MCF4098997.1 universal stress protein [Maritalea mediterranea]